MTRPPLPEEPGETAIERVHVAEEHRVDHGVDGKCGRIGHDGLDVFRGYCALARRVGAQLFEFAADSSRSGREAW